MKKIKFFIDYDKEEKWLNEMARKGYRFEEKGLAYHFRKSEPENDVIKVDHRSFPERSDYQDYLTLFEDSGWQHVAGKKGSGKQYFRRVGGDENYSIFSDIPSKAERYQRAAKIWAGLAATYILMIIILSISGNFDLNALVKPALFYLTPDLWQMEGEVFWRAFWLETPFALFRAFLVYSFLCMLFLSVFFWRKADRNYRRDIKGVV